MQYVISAINSPFGEPIGKDAHTTDMEDAILRWFQLSKKYPTCTSIQPETIEDGMELLKWAKFSNLSANRHLQ